MNVIHEQSHMEDKHGLDRTRVEKQIVENLGVKLGREEHRSVRRSYRGIHYRICGDRNHEPNRDRGD